MFRFNVNHPAALLPYPQTWLTNTQKAIASEELPQCVNEAEKLLQQHHAVKLEIDNYSVSVLLLAVNIYTVSQAGTRMHINRR